MLSFGRVGWGRLALALAMQTGAAWAQVAPPADTTRLETSQLADKSPVSLELYSDSPEVSVEALRAALAAELDAEIVALGSAGGATARRVTVNYRPATKELAVSFSEPQRGTVTRVVEAPSTPSEVIATAALLAGNLAHYGPPAPPPSPPAAAQEPAPPAPAPATRAVTTSYLERSVTPPLQRFANAAFFYPLAANLDHPDLKTHLSFNLIYGKLGELEGLELGSFNNVTGKMSGVEIGALANKVGSEASGLQVATAFNSAQQFEGIQLTAGVNRVGGSSSGAQLAGLANVDGGNVDGLQLSLFNLASNVSGAQLGLINVAAKVRGVQLGLVNVADDVEGAPIGLASVTRSGGVHPLIWSSSVAYVNVALKFATRYTYTFFGMSGHREPDDTQLGPTLGIGFSVPVVKQRLLFEPDISALHLFGDTACCDGKLFGARERRSDHSQFKLRAALRYQVAKHFSAFLGGGVVGSLRYPTDEKNNTQYELRTLLEGFGGVQL